MKITIVKSKKRKEMEQNIFGMFNEDETQVAQILVHDLPHVILGLKGALPFTWGCKMMRSAIQVTPTTTQCAAAPPLHHGGAVVAPRFKAPSTPTHLSLSFTESDDKTKKPLRLKASHKRTRREDYLNIIEDLTKTQASLNHEIENVKRYSDQLRAFNLKLKERKQELNYNKSESKNPTLVNASVNSSNSMAENQGQQLQLQVSNTSHNEALPLMLNHTSGSSQQCNNEGTAQFQYVAAPNTTTSLQIQSHSSSSRSALGMVNTSNIGPHGIVDLNVKEFIQVEPSQPLDVTAVNNDLHRTMAAQARQRRIQIIRLKNYNGNRPRLLQCI